MRTHRTAGMAIPEQHRIIMRRVMNQLEHPRLQSASATQSHILLLEHMEYYRNFLVEPSANIVSAHLAAMSALMETDDDMPDLSPSSGASHWPCDYNLSSSLDPWAEFWDLPDLRDPADEPEGVLTNSGGELS
jgi:hypothetical protein